MIETWMYVASSVVGALAGVLALAAVTSDALNSGNRVEPRRTVALSNVRRSVLLTAYVALAMVLCVWVVFFPPLPAGIARWLLVSMNVLIALVLVFELVARREVLRQLE